MEKYSDYYRANGLVDAKDRKVLILASSVTTKPQPNDRVTIQNVTFVIQNVSPDHGCWECQERM